MKALRRRIGEWTCAAIAVAVLGVSAPEHAHAGVQKGFNGVVIQDLMAPEEIERMRRGGVGAVRLLINWSEIHQANGSFDFSASDRDLTDIAAVGARPLPFLFGTPPWLAASATTKPPLDPAGREAWKQFVTAVVRRYGRDGSFWVGKGQRAVVRRWQIWNEQNLDGHWHPAANAGEYATLLRIGSRTIRAIDPRASILIGGLPPAGAGIPPARFLRNLYKSKRTVKAFDSVASHPYGVDIGDMKHQVKLLRTEMRQGGTPRRPLFVTEIGWGSTGPRGRSLAGSPSAQARITRRTYSTLARRRFRWRIKGVFWFAWRDVNRANVCHFCSSSGLLGVDGEPKPAWQQWKKTAAKIRR